MFFGENAVQKHLTMLKCKKGADEMKERSLFGREAKKCDEYTINTLGVPQRKLMENAAESLANEIIKAKYDLSKTIVVCGSGNNGGDGFAAARFLAEKARVLGLDFDIKTYFAGVDSAMTDACAEQRQLATSCGIEEMPEFCTESVTLIIDAIFGIGLCRNIEGKYKELIDKINASGATVVSADIPSGVCSDTGRIMGTAVKADMTVTFASFKIGLFLYPGTELCGKVIKTDIGITTEVLDDSQPVFTAQELPPFPLPKRSPSSNKGTYGKILIVGGAKNMAGAAYLSAIAAYRSGAGLVRIFTTEENRIILQTLLPEAVLITYDKEIPQKVLADAISDSNAIVAGPGLSQSEMAKIQLKCVLENAKVPLILDADALNILASEKNLWEKLPPNVIITPHMGEMSRLSGKAIDALKENQINEALSFASQKGVVCVLKDARTAVSDGRQTYLNIKGNSGMSKGGAGDVLTGVIAAFAAQGVGCFEAASLGVYIHSLAGDIAAERMGEYSLLARDIADSISDAIKTSSEN